MSDFYQAGVIATFHRLSAILERPFLAVLLLEYALISLDHLYRRTSTDVAVLNQYIHNIGK